MMEPSEARQGGMDRWLGRTIAINWEMVAWVAIVVLTLVTRLWNLGDRAMSHDESLHTYYSWRLYDGQGYAHDPMMHGPLLFHATALFYWLFGANDATARLLAVVAGTLLVLSPLLVRKWLSPAGALAAGAMLLASPTVMYYSRYIRHDIPVELFTVLMGFGFIRFLDSRQARWIVLAFAAGAGAVTSAEMSYINAFVLLSFVVIALLAERLPRSTAQFVDVAFIGIGAGLLVFAVLASQGKMGDVATEGSVRRVAMQMGFLLSGMFLIYGLASALLYRVRSVPTDGVGESDWRLLDMLPAELGRRNADEPARAWRVPMVGMVGLILGVVLWRLPELTTATLASSVTGVGLLLVTVGFFLVLYGSATWIAGRRIAAANVICLVVGAVATALFLVVWRSADPSALALSGWQNFTIGLRAPALALVVASAFTFFLGLLGWFLEVHETRGLAAALANAPVEAIAAGAVVFVVIYSLLFTTFFTNAPGINGFARSVQYWLDQHDVVRGGQPWYYYALFTPMYEFLPVLLTVVGLVWYSLRRLRRVATGNDTGDPDGPSAAAWAFLPMLFVWALGNFWIYSWAGEKMPWLIVHLVVPMTFIGGRVIGDWVALADWQAMRQRGWIVGGLSVLFVIVLGSVLVGGALQGGQSLAALETNMRWILGLGILGLLLAGLWYFGKGLSRRQAMVSVGLCLAAMLFVVNTRYALMANFVNDELATEYIVYAHATPDDKEVFNMLLEMQERLSMGQELNVGYDNEVSWPFTWYFRKDVFPNAQYLGEKPSGALHNEVVLVGSPNYSAFEPYLRDRYVSTEFRRMWWPNEGYKGLTIERLRTVLVDPKERRNWINILLFRNYSQDPLADDPQPKSLTDWYHHANMRMYVRKDLIEQIWPLVQARPDWLRSVEAEAPTISKSVAPVVEMTYEVGQDAQPLIAPKGLALGSDGSLYVVDHGQLRIAVFDAAGGAVSTLGEGELQETYSESPGPSAWGVGVGPDGAVYVADTWNHRVLKFVDGRQTASFGMYGNPESPQTDLDVLFGPRDADVGPDGNVYVTDTGNDRVVVLDSDLRPLRAFGGSGIGPGEFDEPTSLAFDRATGEMVVADLWNLRVQRFDRDLMAIDEWSVEGWISQEAAHKAYIAVGPGGAVVASDPVGQRVWIWDRDGNLLATLDLPDDPRGLDQPIGIDVDATGRIYVASSNSNIVTRYAPLDVLTQLGDTTGTVGGEGEEGSADAVGGGDEEQPGDGGDEGGAAGEGDAGGDEEGASSATPTDDRLSPEAGGTARDGATGTARDGATGTARDGATGTARDGAESTGTSADGGAPSATPRPSPTAR